MNFFNKYKLWLNFLCIANAFYSPIFGVYINLPNYSNNTIFQENYNTYKEQALSDIQKISNAQLLKYETIIKENIFENRYLHCAELRRLGAIIIVRNKKAIILGGANFEGAELMSSDLRASVALVLAAIAAKGKSIIHRIYHLSRGYENLDKKLKKIGVNIKKIS